MNFTPLARFLLGRRVKEALSWTGRTQEIQLGQLDFLLRNLRQTKWGAEKGLSEVRSYDDFRRLLPSVSAYAGLRPYVMRMIAGEKDVLWPGLTRNFAQSSGTSDGKSKYIPVTPASFSRSHYKGGSSVISHYLSLYPDSRIFAGKSFILGGSFANELTLPPGVRVGDLSANLIENINPLVNLTRVPPKRIALLEDWAVKLPALVSAAADHDITNISGVPSTVSHRPQTDHQGKRRADNPRCPAQPRSLLPRGHLDGPYREQYSHITDPKMRYPECYNASEGFFAVRTPLTTGPCCFCSTAEPSSNSSARRKPIQTARRSFRHGRWRKGRSTSL